MTDLIQCTGTINCDGLNYLDPLINVYYLSYNSSTPIYAFPQIVDANLSVQCQLFMGEVGPGSNLTRIDVENAIIMLLESTYTNCTFTKTKI